VLLREVKPAAETKQRRHGERAELHGRTLRGVLLEQFGDGTFELRQAPVDFDHLVRCDGVERIDVGLVDRPLHAAFAAVEVVAVTMRAVDVDRRVLYPSPTRAFRLLWFLL
jgi:hypothetical protein